MTPLPIDAVLPQIVEAMRATSSIVIRAPTGAGKTTRVPPAILDSGIAGDGAIVMLQPRRLAARTAARRMAFERGGRLGDEVGFRIRFERVAGPETRILVVTEGILTRMLQEDPFLEGVGAVILDEFHERHLETDLALGMLCRVQQTVRSEVRIVVMSATLDVGPVASYLGGAPVVESAGRTFPVDVEYAAGTDNRPLAARIATGVEEALRRTTGDLLVFLPGVGEIRQAHRALAPLAGSRGLSIVDLYGDLPAEQQDAVLARGTQRKVVLATNVAETSVTIEGITAVVDSGLARVMQFDPHVGLDRLRLQSISKASADQRAGRAGRTQAGLCLRLWSEASHRARPDHDDPEVRRVDLSGPVLELLCWGEPDVAAFPWFEQPRTKSFERAERLLRRLGALDGSGPTELGRRMAKLPVHPRIARLLLEGDRLHCAEQAALAAALLSERDPFRASGSPPSEGGTGGVTFETPGSRTRGNRPMGGVKNVAASSLSDVVDRVAQLDEFDRTGRNSASINVPAARFVFKARDQLLRLIGSGRSQGSRTKAADSPANSPDATTIALRRALLAAFPDRLARRRAPGSPRGVMVGGRGVVLGPDSAVREAELFLCIDVDGAKGEAVVRKASAVERSWLPPERIATTVDVLFDAEAERVSARRRVRFDDLILEESPAPVPDGDTTAAVLAEAAASRWDRVFPPDDAAVAQFIARVRCLRDWMPEFDLPPLDDDDLKSLLPLACVGRRALADLRRVPWIDVISTRLSHSQWSTVEREAPERIAVPSGSRIALTYEPGRPPVLAVRIQELFGLEETPRIAGGRIRVLLHLLAPNMRPQQVTDDLASFWANGYPLVRKELRARYPKHDWPEDPAKAAPQRGAKRRR